MSSFGVKPSESQHTSISMFEDYPAQTARISPRERKGIRQAAQAIAETSPSDAISYLASQRGYTNFRPDLLMGKLMARPADYDKFKTVAGTAFQDLLGRTMSNADWRQTTEYAKTMGVKDPNAFEALLSKRLASTPEGQAKIKSEADIAWESMYGNMPRDAQGNLMRGLVLFRPDKVASSAASMANTIMGL